MLQEIRSWVYLYALINILDESPFLLPLFFQRFNFLVWKTDLILYNIYIII